MPQSVSIESIKDKIAKVEYYPWPDSTLTICVITMQNGYSVRGESACVDMAAYNPAKGKLYAYEDAFRKIWALEGYLLKQQMFDAANIERHMMEHHPVNHPLDRDTILKNNGMEPT